MSDIPKDHLINVDASELLDLQDHIETMQYALFDASNALLALAQEELSTASAYSISKLSAQALEGIASGAGKDAVKIAKLLNQKVEIANTVGAGLPDGGIKP